MLLVTGLFSNVGNDFNEKKSAHYSDLLVLTELFVSSLKGYRIQSILAISDSCIKCLQCCTHISRRNVYCCTKYTMMKAISMSFPIFQLLGKVGLNWNLVQKLFFSCTTKMIFVNRHFTKVVKLTCLNASVDDFYWTEPLHTGNT